MCETADIPASLHKVRSRWWGPSARASLWSGSVGAVDERHQPLRRPQAVAVREQLAQFVPVGPIVEYQADGVAAPAEEEERRAAVAQGRELPGLQVVRPSLEDVYLELVRTAEEAGA